MIYILDTFNVNCIFSAHTVYFSALCILLCPSGHNRTDFIPYEVNRRPGRKQAEHKPYPGEIDMGTTYKQDFNPYQVTPCVAVRPKQRVQAAPGKLDTVPTYKGDAFDHN